MGVGVIIMGLPQLSLSCLGPPQMGPRLPWGNCDPPPSLRAVSHRARSHTDCPLSCRGPARCVPCPPPGLFPLFTWEPAGTSVPCSRNTSLRTLWASLPSASFYGVALFTLQ